MRRVGTLPGGRRPRPSWSQRAKTKRTVELTEKAPLKPPPPMARRAHPRPGLARGRRLAIRDARRADFTGPTPRSPAPWSASTGGSVGGFRVLLRGAATAAAAGPSGLRGLAPRSRPRRPRPACRSWSAWPHGPAGSADGFPVNSALTVLSQWMDQHEQRTPLTDAPAHRVHADRLRPGGATHAARGPKE
jgi:hypothetical protein